MLTVRKAVMADYDSVVCEKTYGVEDVFLDLLSMMEAIDEDEAKALRMWLCILLRKEFV